MDTAALKELLINITAAYKLSTETVRVLCLDVELSLTTINEVKRVLADFPSNTRVSVHSVKQQSKLLTESLKLSNVDSYNEYIAAIIRDSVTAFNSLGVVLEQKQLESLPFAMPSYLSHGRAKVSADAVV